MSKSYFKGEPDDETRQQFANWCVQSLQRELTERGAPLPFEALRSAFVAYGSLYDGGNRLRDLRAA